MPDKGFFDKVYDIVRTIPPGGVMTYGQIAMLLGNPLSSRIVGYAMSGAPEGLPAHRVVKKNGELCRGGVFGGRQRELLEAEGVRFRPDGRVDIARCIWWGGDAGHTG